MAGNGATDPSEKPLKGAVLCCTSIPPEQRSDYAEIAVQMGAEHKLDLTSDVTHLLVGDSNTPKYKYVAREREDVKVLMPEWIEAVRQSWMKGDAFSVEALENEFRFPTFAGLSICLTGFEDLAFRAQLQQTIVANGGNYQGDLTKTITHLIAHTPEGKKYQYATQWQVKVVGLKWFKDSLDRSMVLEEVKYHPTIPKAEQGIGAWNREAKAELQVNKRRRDDEAPQDAPRKLRRTASAKLGSQTDSLWRDIVGGGFDPKDGDSSEQLRPSKSLPVLKSIVLEPKSFTSEGTLMDQRADSYSDNCQPPLKMLPQASRGYLEGRMFFIYGFNSRQKAILRSCLNHNGGVITDSLMEMNEPLGDGIHSAYVLVPYNCPLTEIPPVEAIDPTPSVVTDMWVERCLDCKTFVDPRQHSTSSPLCKFPITGFGKLVVNSTGFERIELLHISKVIKLVGAVYDEVLKPGVSVLVCNSTKPNEDKLRHARKWDIAAVSADWLWACLKEGKLLSFEAYLIPIELTHMDMRQMPKSKGQEASREQEVERKQEAANTREVTGQRQRQRSEQRDSHSQDSGPLMNLAHHTGSRLGDETETQIENLPLREISSNSPPKHAPMSPIKRKKSLFRSLDGTARSRQGNQEDSPPPVAPAPTSSTKTTYIAPQPDSINEAIHDLLNKTAKARSVASSVSNRGGIEKRLLGRALSNMSNSSREVLTRQLSREGSVDSLNTDGVGSVIMDETTRYARHSSLDIGGRRTRQSSFSGKATEREDPLKAASVNLDDSGLYRDEFHDVEAEPQRTQLGYAESEEAILLREKLAERRRGRSRAGQESTKSREVREERKIRDDDAIVGGGWGAGRRTRHQARSPTVHDEL